MPDDQNFDRAEVREGSKTILGLFRIWEFLRSKLAQRREPNFRTQLWLADEFAWLCYKPIYDRGFKEPPLVFLNGGYSPFTLTRKTEFQAESVPQELIQDQKLIEAMASLPFPVIGVPWYQAQNVAELPVIGHELGHSVEADLDLEGDLNEAIAKAVKDPDRRSCWLDWRSEVFADVYGSLACGPSFVSTLAEFLSAEDPDDTPDEYPPPAVRFEFNLAVLRSLDFPVEAEQLAQQWGQAPSCTRLTRRIHESRLPARCERHPEP